MARVKLAELKKYRFKHQIEVRYTDVNIGGHLGNSQMVELIHQIRYQVLKDLGLNEGNLGDGQTGLTVSDLVVNYLKESFPGDLLFFETDIQDFDQKSFRMYHRVSKREKLIALAEVGLVAFSFITRKSGQVPESFKELVSS